MIKPAQRQLEFMDWELGVFFHFGIRTYNEGHVDWDGRHMDLKSFNPTNLDCNQWIKSAKLMGAKYAVFTAKHHDGFANWNSCYTKYSVANTDWKNGNGDVVKEFVNACRNNSLKVGIYYSPAEFGSKAHDGYDDYFINQISELLTNYGKIDYLWFDGCGSEGHKYNEKRIISHIRRLQPDILIFNMWDPDTRWVGNEDGYAPEQNLNLVDSLDFSTMTDKKDNLKSKRFLPAECDCRIRDNWFYCDTDKNTLKSLDNLMDIYENSVGHGANLLLNVAPNRDGIISDEDCKRLNEFGQEISKRYGKPDIVFTGNIISMAKPIVIDRIILKENMKDGQHINNFKINIVNSQGEQNIYTGSTIGHKRICKFNAVKANKIKIIIDSGKLEKGYIFKEA